MGVSILVQPDILIIPYGDRHRIIDAARGKKDLADLASGNPEMPVPSFIIERIKTSLDSATMRFYLV
jgi:aspartate/methionine/tyrosine aminotransferase